MRHGHFTPENNFAYEGPVGMTPRTLLPMIFMWPNSLSGELCRWRRWIGKWWLNRREEACMSSQMRVCPGSIGWVVVDQLVKGCTSEKMVAPLLK